MSNLLGQIKRKARYELDMKGIYLDKERVPVKRSTLAICDENTLEIARKFCDEPFVLEGKNGRAVANDKNVKLIVKEAENKACDSIMAFGSGSLNDIAKYASFLGKIPYTLYLTAPSMNGMLSDNASIEVNGVKRGAKAHIPNEIYLDMQTLCNSPIRLIKSGFGDAMARQVAQGDMFLSHTVHGSRYEEKYFEITKASEDYLAKNYKLLESRDDDFIFELVCNLLLSGVSMHMYGNSTPASGAEHAICHYLEQKYHNKMDEFYHGEQVACATIAMIRIQKQFKEHKNFHRNENMQLIFEKLGLPYHYSHLGLKVEDWEDALQNAHLIRDRYTFLHLFNTQK